MQEGMSPFVAITRILDIFLASVPPTANDLWKLLVESPTTAKIGIDASEIKKITFDT